MPTPLESAIEGTVVRWGKANGIRTLKIRDARGWPDRLFLCDGRVLFIEFKRPGSGGRLSTLQKRMIERLEGDGFWVAVINSVEDGILELKRLRGDA